VGGESTRPGAEPGDAHEELRRILPVVDALCKKTNVPISIDTSKAMVAQRAADAGAEVINDVTSLKGDPSMISLAVETGCGVCIMHMRGTPRTMQNNPIYDDVVAEVLDDLRARRDALPAVGIEHDRIAIDPGIGFGKTTEHNLQLLANAWRFHALDSPVLVGHSRKRFLDGFISSNAADSTIAGEEKPKLPLDSARTAGTIGVGLSLARQGVQILRVHDVAAMRQALLFFDSTGGLE